MSGPQTARAAAEQFFAHAMSLYGTQDWQIGLIYDAESGWRVYQAIGGKALAMDHGTTRKMAEKSIRWIKRKSDTELARHNMTRDATLPLINMFEEMIALAKEARENIRTGKVPEGYVEAMPTMGRA